MSAFALLLGALAAFFITRGVTRGAAAILDRLGLLLDHCTTDLALGLDAVAGGDLTRSVTPVTPPIDDPGYDEIGRIAAAVNVIRDNTVASVEAYNRMREQLAGVMGELSDSATTVSSASQQMASTSSEAGRAVHEIAAAVGDVALGAERQVRMVESTRTAVQEASRTALSSADTARRPLRRPSTPASSPTTASKPPSTPPTRSARSRMPRTRSAPRSARCPSARTASAGSSTRSPGSPSRPTCSR